MPTCLGRVHTKHSHAGLGACVPSTASRLAARTPGPAARHARQRAAHPPPRRPLPLGGMPGGPAARRPRTAPPQTPRHSPCTWHRIPGQGSRGAGCRWRDISNASPCAAGNCSTKEADAFDGVLDTESLWGRLRVCASCMPSPGHPDSIWCVQRAQQAVTAGPRQRAHLSRAISSCAISGVTWMPCANTAWASASRPCRWGG